MKNKMTIFIAILCVCCMSFALIACNNADDTPPEQNDEDIDTSQVVVIDGTTLTKLTDYGKTLSKIVIPDGVTSLGKLAFSGDEKGSLNTNLINVEIPDSVTSIDFSAFYGCSNLTCITVDLDNAKYKSDGNCIIEKDTNTLILGCKGSIIPNYVTGIGEWAFFYCSGLTSIDIPSSVTSIGGRAFFNCYNLSSIDMPNSVTSIGEWSFYFCKSLTGIELSSNLTSIGEYAFYYCKSLTDVVIPKAVTSIGYCAFYECSSLTLYCEAQSKPYDWNSKWNAIDLKDNTCIPVIWGYSINSK